jgi:hypothetical protein
MALRSLPQVTVYVRPAAPSSALRKSSYTAPRPQVLSSPSQESSTWLSRPIGGTRTGLIQLPARSPRTTFWATSMFKAGPLPTLRSSHPWAPSYTKTRTGIRAPLLSRSRSPVTEARRNGRKKNRRDGNGCRKHGHQHGAPWLSAKDPRPADRDQPCSQPGALQHSNTALTWRKRRRTRLPTRGG